MRPCDCNDRYTESKLNEQGCGINENIIAVDGGRVRLEIGPMRIYVSRGIFKMFAEWYLEDQKEGGQQ